MDIVSLVYTLSICSNIKYLYIIKYLCQIYPLCIKTLRKIFCFEIQNLNQKSSSNLYFLKQIIMCND